MLQEVVVNVEIKQVLHEVATLLIPVVLEPIRKSLDDNGCFDDLPGYIQKSIQELAENHSWQLRQLGALLPNIATSQEIVNEKEKIKFLLEKIQALLLHCHHINDVSAASRFIKALLDLCRCYFEFFPACLHGNDYSRLKKALWPSTEEIDFRIKRTELGEDSQVVIGEKGIGTQPDIDLVSVNDEHGQRVGRIAGKSIFWGCDMSKRLQLIVDGFDEQIQDTTMQHNVAEYKRLKNLLSYAQDFLNHAHSELAVEKQPHLELKINVLMQRLIEIQSLCPANLMKMEYYHIPLDKSERMPIEEYAKLCEPIFKKLAGLSGLSLPFVASISGSTLRTLITLYDIGAFVYAGNFQVEKIQIIANCIMGFFIQSGHHSYFEVAESYNRLLDYLVLEHAVKQRPYYVMGNYLSFLHGSYATRVIARAGLEVETLLLQGKYNT